MTWAVRINVLAAYSYIFPTNGTANTSPAARTCEHERNRTAWIMRHDARLRWPSSKLRKPAAVSNLSEVSPGWRLKFEIVKAASYVNFGLRIQCNRETFSSELRELPFPHCSLSLSRFEGHLWLVVVASEPYESLIVVGQHPLSSAYFAKIGNISEKNCRINHRFSNYKYHKIVIRLSM